MVAVGVVELGVVRSLPVAKGRRFEFDHVSESKSQPAAYLAIALRIRLAPSLARNTVFAAAFSASS